MRGSFNLGRIFGIQIGINYTWVFAFLLFAFIFAQNFHVAFPSWSSAEYWIAGVIMAVGLFVCVLIHELCHSIVARSRGLKVSSIVLFIFGGVSNIENEPERPGVEFIMAFAGPASSAALGGIFYGLHQLAAKPGVPDTPLAGILYYLFYINIILAIFNLIPGFPLDGGRVLRAIVWGATRSLHTATVVAGNIGRYFGWAFILLGILGIFGFGIVWFEGTLNGIWAIFIGWFLLSAADSSLRDLSLRENLAGKKVRDLMDMHPECVSPAESVERVVHDSFIMGGRRALPVCNDTGLLGIVTLADVKKVPQDNWANTPVQTIMTPGDKLLTVNQEDDLNGALAIMARNGLNQIPVMGESHLVGLLSREQVLRYLQTRQELGIRKGQGPGLSR
jgi:Zn-dependent protease